MEHTPPTITKVRYTIWKRIADMCKTTPAYLKGKTGYMVKYSDGTVTKIKLS